MNRFFIFVLAAAISSVLAAHVTAATSDLEIADCKENTLLWHARVVHTCPGKNSGKSETQVSIYSTRFTNNGRVQERMHQASWMHQYCDDENGEGPLIYGYFNTSKTPAKYFLNAKKPRGLIRKEFAHSGAAQNVDGASVEIKLKSDIIVKFNPTRNNRRQESSVESDSVNCTITDSDKTTVRYENLAKNGIKGLIKMTFTHPDRQTKSVLVDLGSTKTEISNTWLSEEHSLSERMRDITLHTKCPQ